MIERANEQRLNRALADARANVVSKVSGNMERSWQGKGGLRVLIRPIEPSDEGRLVEFHQSLSEETVRHRYFGLISLATRTGHDRLARVCQNDPDRDLALVAQQMGPSNCFGPILGVARLCRTDDPLEAEFAIVIEDAAQGHGLGSEMMRQLIAVAREEGLRELHGDVQADNLVMCRMFCDLGFALTPTSDPTIYRAHLKLA